MSALYAANVTDGRRAHKFELEKISEGNLKLLRTVMITITIIMAIKYVFIARRSDGLHVNRSFQTIIITA
jgi:hypothetical protein